MKKVLVLASVASMIDQFNMPNIKLLQALGYEVHVACNFLNGSTCSDERIKKLINTLDELGVKHYQIDFSRSVTDIVKIVEAYKQVKAIMNDVRYEFVHCHSPIGGMIARIAGVRTNTRVIYTAHGFHFYKGAPLVNWLIYYPVEWLCSYFTEVLITINQEDYDLAQKHMHAKKVICIPGVGINLALFEKKTTNREMIRQALGIKENDIALIYVAELNDNKNQSMLIKMMSLLCEKRNDIKLVLVGKGECEERYKEEAKKYNLIEKIIFTGYRNDVPDLYAASDIAVPSSIREGLGLNVVEAMASGVPVVACDNRGHRTIVENEKNGFLIKNGDYVAMAEQVLRLINDPSEYSRISQIGRERAQCFGNNVVGGIMKEIYTTIEY